jgi:type IV pilus assembly protein PilB
VVDIARVNPGSPPPFLPARLRPPIGEALVEAGFTTAEAVEQALATQKIEGGRLGDLLVRQGAVTESQLVRVLAEQFGIRFVDLEDQVADPDAGRRIREAFARRLRAVGIGWDGEALIVAMANPSDVFALDDIRTLVGCRVVPVMAVGAHIDRLLDRLFHDGAGTETALAAATDEAQREQLREATAAIEVRGNDGRDETDEAPVVRFVNELLARAVHEGASDLHIEPTRSELRIRFRVDGVLRDLMAVPRPLQSRVVSRLKILCDMDIADRRAPQDGRAGIVVRGRRVDIRAVSFPTTNGEAVVLRLLDKSGSVIDIHELGFQPAALDRYRACYEQSSGAILVTGPTGSGKSTTLYATLQEVNRADRNIITVEDPVEYELEGIKQVQVEPKAGVTFASALRSLLRADPDILLVGEVRDQDTARLAVDAALTGHLVLSSLHTRSAAATPARLVKMGIEPFLVTSALQCILAQRLARKLCERCRVPAHPKDDVLARMGWTEADRARPEGATFFAAGGCETCGGSGYVGRFAIHEVMPITDKVADAITEWAPPAEIEAIAVRQGMITLQRDGLLKAAAGLTTLEELHRVSS